MLFERVPVLVRGGGDLGSGAIYRLHRAGFPVILAELEAPLCVRRAVCFASAVLEGHVTVEEITARLVTDWEAVGAILRQGEVPVVVDAAGEALALASRQGLAALAPKVVVDARMAKRNLGTTREDALLVIALGPGFEAGVDCHAVVETNRGHYLGRVYWTGRAEADTGVPGQIGGVASKRVLRAPAHGYVLPRRAIGERVRAGEIVAEVDGHPVRAAIDGVLRGLIHPRVPVHPGLKIGDVDPRARREHCFTISDKSLAVGGGVLEAVLSFGALRDELGCR